MVQETDTTTPVQTGLLRAYFKIGAAILIGIFLVLAIYFLVKKGDPTDPTAAASQGVCACPNCGMTVFRPAGSDCEEMNCPNCGHSMTRAEVLAAAMERRELLARPLPSPRREEFTRAGRLVLPEPRGAGPGGSLAIDPMPVGGACVCPGCGRTVEHQPGVSCLQMRCPVCGTFMTNAVYIGRKPAFPRQREAVFAGMGMPAAAGQPPCLQGANPCPLPGATAGTQGCVGFANSVYGILQKNCMRCHAGPIRDLTTYDRVKAYADNGLLMMMVQPGGPMSRFLSADEANQIITWIKAGAPP